MKTDRILVFIPTFNERENVRPLCEQLLKLDLPLDILFLDDNSPDGTGEVLKELAALHPRVRMISRSGKQGIGSAHQVGIARAYAEGYPRLVTMDSDFTHDPADVLRLVAAAQGQDVCVGSRYLQQDSLPGWNWRRKLLTWLGHELTQRFLDLPQDASGAFRYYDLQRVPQEVFALVQSRSYSFFFESLFILRRNGYSIAEIPISLPARTYGTSKMTYFEALRSLKILFQLFVANLRRPERFLLERKVEGLDPSLNDPQNWDNYWNRPKSKTGLLYDLIAGIYRNGVIKKNLNHYACETFPPDSSLLHAGCGSGQVDVDLQRKMKIMAIDISPAALQLYARNNPLAAKVEHGNIFDLKYDEGTFDGVYNLGVMEHFSHSEIISIFRQFHRVLRPGGKVLIFWPHRFATSVWVLKGIHLFLKLFSAAHPPLHPAEPSLTRGRREVSDLLKEAGFHICSYHFGPRDFFVQAVVVAEKP